MQEKPYAGAWTALIMPFKADGSVDEAALRKLVQTQVGTGLKGVVPLGTTGEAPTTTAEEDRRTVEIVVEEARKGNLKVMVGTGSNSTAEAVKYTRVAKELGADACLVVSPYYNKPTREGLKLHYAAVADVGLPVIVYNIKGRTAVNIDTPTLMEIAKHPMIVGVKEASGDMEQMKEVLAQRSENFTVLSGDDNMTFPLMFAGGDGIISVASNIVPKKIATMVEHASQGRWKEAETIHQELSDIFSTIFVETNPIPIKYCAYKMGLCELSFRLPMCPPVEASRVVLDSMLKKNGLIA